MTNLIQMIYISRSTFAQAEITNGIEPNVARILLKSRANNKKNGLVGVLYFGNGCFFQCLEGAAETVQARRGNCQGAACGAGLALVA